MVLLRAVKRLFAEGTKLVWGPVVEQEPYRCIKCGDEYERDRTTCPTCGGFIAEPDDSE